MFPVPIIIARAGWFVAGALVGALAKSSIGKEAVDTFKDGVKGMCDTYKKDTKDMTEKEKRTFQEKEQMVKNIKEGRM